MPGIVVATADEESQVKIRFGVGTGSDTEPEDLPTLVDRLEALGIDSLWFSEHVYSPAVDPIVGMAAALSRTDRLKVGTSVAILPGRHPVLVAKQLASLALLAPKRVLPVFGLRPARAEELDLFPVSADAAPSSTSRCSCCALCCAPMTWISTVTTSRSTGLGWESGPPGRSISGSVAGRRARSGASAVTETVGWAVS